MSTFSIRQANAFRKVRMIITRRPSAFFMTALTFAIAFMLPFAAYLILYNLIELDQLVDYKPSLTVYMETTANSQQLSDTGVLINRLPSVQHITIVDKATVLTNMQADAEFRQALSLLTNNPFPDTIIVTPKGLRPAELGALQAELAKMKSVEKVDIDSIWVRRLNALIDFGQSLIIATISVLSIIILTMAIAIGRIEILRDTHEMSVAYLVGGTPSTIRRPYVYYGFILGIVSGLIGALLVFGLYYVLTPDVLSLAQAYQSDFTPHFIRFKEMAILVGVNGILGAIGAWIAAQCFSFDESI